jgi:hypothetical protein
MAARLRRLPPDLRDAGVEAADFDVGVALPANKSGVGLRMKLDYEKQERTAEQKRPPRMERGGREREPHSYEPGGKGHDNCATRKSSHTRNGIAMLFNP